MKRLRLVFFTFAVLWSTYELALFLLASNVAPLIDSRVTAGELLAISNGVVASSGLWVLVRSLYLWRSTEQFHQVRGFLGLFMRRETLAISVLAVIPNTATTATVSQSDVGVSIRSLIEPAVAIALFRRLIARQRFPSNEVSVETRLTENSARTVHDLRRYAIESVHLGVATSGVSTDELDVHLNEVISVEPAVTNVVDSWDIVLRLYGFPYVESRNGVRASFAKKRSVEVLSWLGMNMDRARRSAVRTAVWDVEISDASFSTVMSDIRRGISSVTTERSREEIFPPTFSDHIDVGVRLITDFDLLHRTLARFRDDETAIGELVSELQLIRDIPFAGVNYMWADLDGTTTRMVLLALQAACEVAEWARNKNDVETCATAVKAGLRVMPGHEELLAIQHSFISQRSMSQA